MAWKFSRSETAKMLKMAGLGPAPKPLLNPRNHRPAPLLAVPYWLLRFVVPVRTHSLTNKRDAHWRDRHLRAKDERKAVDDALLAAGLSRVTLPPPFLVNLTRLGGQKLDDDNLKAALKSIRDQVADWLQVDDGDEAAATWAYDQQPGVAWGVLVEVRPTTGGASA